MLYWSGSIIWEWCLAECLPTSGVRNLLSGFTVVFLFLMPIVGFYPNQHFGGGVTGSVDLWWVEFRKYFWIFWARPSHSQCRILWYTRCFSVQHTLIHWISCFLFSPLGRAQACYLVYHSILYWECYGLAQKIQKYLQTFVTWFSGYSKLCCHLPSASFS